MSPALIAVFVIIPILAVVACVAAYFVFFVRQNTGEATVHAADEATEAVAEAEPKVKSRSNDAGGRDKDKVRPKMNEILPASAAVVTGTIPMDKPGSGVAGVLTGQFPPPSVVNLSQLANPSAHGITMSGLDVMQSMQSNVLTGYVGAGAAVSTLHTGPLGQPGGSLAGWNAAPSSLAGGAVDSFQVPSMGWNPASSIVGSAIGPFQAPSSLAGSAAGSVKWAGSAAGLVKAPSVSGSDVGSFQAPSNFGSAAGSFKQGSGQHPFRPAAASESSFTMRAGASKWNGSEQNPLSHAQSFQQQRAGPNAWNNTGQAQSFKGAASHSRPVPAGQQHSFQIGASAMPPGASAQPLLPPKKCYASKDALKLYQRFKVGYGEIAIGAQLGSGAFGSVHQCKYRGSDQCAVKQLTSVGASNEDVRKAFMKEVRIMCSLSHPCTIRIFAWIERPPAMVMELALCDLRHYYQDKEEGGSRDG